MSRIEDAFQTNIPLHEEQINEGLVCGTLHRRADGYARKTVLLIHGMSGNRFGLQILGQRLAKYGFASLVIDLPQHDKNKNQLSLGMICETINASVSLLKNRTNISQSIIIGHSIGAVAALFASTGYNRTVEKSVFEQWSQLINLTEALNDAVDKDSDSVLLIEKEIDNVFSQIKKNILEALRQRISTNVAIESYIFLAPPLNCKKAIPGLNILRRMPFKIKKSIFELLFHHPKKEQNIRPNPNAIQWQYFELNQTDEFLNYFFNMKEPADYMKLLEKLAEFKSNAGKQNFFTYFVKKNSLTPKLFAYGTKDLYLMSMFSSSRNRLEAFYKSCGNATIFRSNFTHVMMNNPSQQLAIYAVDNDELTKNIIRFIEEHRI